MNGSQLCFVFSTPRKVLSSWFPQEAEQRARASGTTLFLKTRAFHSTKKFVSYFENVEEVLGWDPEREKRKLERVKTESQVFFTQ